MGKKKRSKKLTSETKRDNSTIEKIHYALETFQNILITVAAQSADNHNTILGLVGNKIQMNSQLEELVNRVGEVEAELKTLNSQREFQKVPDLVDKLVEANKGIKNALIDVERRSHQGNGPKK